MQINERLESMVGKTYLYHAQYHKILSYKVDGDKITIVTHKKWFDISNKDLNQFLPTSSENGTTSLQVLPKDREFLASLSATIKDNIEQVKKDKSYIPQANSINNSINTLVNLAKIELQMLKMNSK